MQRLKNSSDLLIPNGSSGDPDPLHIAWSKFMTTFNVVYRARVRELQTGGFCQWHAGLLYLLHMYGEGLSISEIARLAGLRNPSVSGIVMRAEKAGLIRRIPDINDSRVVRVELTEKGKKEYIRSLQYRQHIYNIMGSLSENQKVCFLELLEVLKHQAEVELQSFSSTGRKSMKALPKKLNK